MNTTDIKKDGTVGERGWTFIEATLGVILTSIIVLGLAVAMMAMRETVDQSLSIRVMDQYGSDMMAHFQRVFETADEFHAIASQSSGQMDHFELIYIDPFDGLATNHRYQATREQGIKMDNQRIDPQFPPHQMARGKAFGVLGENESFAITHFTAEEAPRQGNDELFARGVIRITLTIRYTRKATESGERDYIKEMTYNTMCFMKNRYLNVEE